MALFPYQPLDTERQDIRLLQIDLNNPHQYQLVHPVPLSIAMFVALSYTWGNHQDTSQLTIDRYVITVSSNLIRALDEVVAFWTTTYPNRRELFLWADQICINQNDDVEKSHQVSMMGEIYSIAGHVLVWLPLMSGVTEGFTIWSEWRDWHREQILDSNLHDLPGTQTAASYAGNNNLVFPCVITQDRRTRDTLLAWSHIHGIICSEWWQRGWVYQEFMQPRRATFLFGGLYAAWDNLHDLLTLYFSQRDAHVKFCTDELNNSKSSNVNGTQTSRWWKLSKTSYITDPTTAKEQRTVLRYHGQQIINAAPSWQRANYILDGKVDLLNQRQVTGTAYIPLSTLLQHSRNCKLSEPKDRIYAFLRLAHPRYSIKIDYSPSHTVSDVYTDAARAIIQVEKRLDILAVALENHRQNNNPYNKNSSNQIQLPSWVPDWSTPSSPNTPYRQFLRAIRLPVTGYDYGAGACRASADLKSTIIFFHPDARGNADRVLGIQGIHVDTLAHSTIYTPDQLYRSFRTGSGRHVDTVPEAQAGDEVWVLLGADEVYTLRKCEERTYRVLGHALVRERDGVTSEIMQGGMVVRKGPGEVVDRLRAGEVEVLTILLV